MAYLNALAHGVPPYAIFGYEYEVVWLLGLPCDLVAGDGNTVGYVSLADLERVVLFRRLLHDG